MPVFLLILFAYVNILFYFYCIIKTDIMKRKVLIQMMADELKANYDYLSKIDAIKYLKPLYKHKGNLMVGDFVKAQILAYGY